MAAIRHRLEEEKADWAIYVTDAGQVCTPSTMASFMRVALSSFLIYPLRSFC
jgi:hypothetical protein